MTPTKGDLRRTAVLDAAERVLVTTGNSNATMRTIAAASNVSIGHLQHYFPARTDLMRAVLDRVLQRSLEWLRETAGIDLDPGVASGGTAPITRDDSGRMVAAIMQQQSDPDVARLYVEIWAMAAADEDIAGVLRDFYRQYARYVERVVQRAQPDLAAGARQAKAHAVVAIFEGAAVVGAGFAGLRSAGSDASVLGAIQHLIHEP